MDLSWPWSDFFTWVARDMKRSSGDESAGFFRRRCASFRDAWHGLRLAIDSEPHLKIHLAATLAVISSGLYFELSVTEWSSVSLAIGLVLASEILNTAIEHLVDIVRPEYDVAAGHVKDIASAAVLVASLTAALIGGLVFGPRLLLLLTL